MQASTLFAAFDESLQPTEEDEDAKLGRALDCVTALHKRYYNDDKPSKRMSLIGSFPKGTSVRPASDIDVVFHMPAGTYKRFHDYVGNGQSALLQEVRSVLLSRFPRTQIKGDGPVAVVEFSSGAAVEVVPAVLVENANILHVNGQVPVTRGGGKWENADYGAQFDRFDELNRRRGGQLARLIRYMKAWRRAHNAIFKSIVMELMAVEFLSSWDSNLGQTGHTYDDWLVRDFLSFMTSNEDTTFRLPDSGKAIETGYGWRTDARASLADAKRACAHDDGSRLYIAAWKQVLGNAFGI